jgi:iron complex transport system substrate-binding protein
MRPSRPVVGALLLLLLFAAACKSSGAPNEGSPSAPTPPSATVESGAFPVTITDDDGVEVMIASEPERIVTFAPSMTEIVYALGLGDRLVGVAGPYDDYPAEAQQIEQVGGAGDFGVDPNLETVVALEPDLFLTISGGDLWKQRLRELGVPVVTLNATDFADLLDDIRIVGRLTGADAVAAMAAGDRVSCFFEVYYSPHAALTTVGPNTFVYDLLERAGCDPVTAGASSDYPEWSVEDLVARGPQVYLATPESATSPAAVARRPGFDGISAVAEGRVVLVDGDLVTRPGPRVVDGLDQLVTALHAPGD